MANYKKITDVEVMEGVTENSMALVNENGVLKQVSCGAGFGGGGVKTAIIVGNYYRSGLSGVAAVAEAREEFTCSNMTFEEARDIILAGEPLMAVCMAKTGGSTNGDTYHIMPVPSIENQLMYATPCIRLHGTIVFETINTDGTNSYVYSDTGINLYWTADRIVNDEDPNGAL